VLAARKPRAARTEAATIIFIGTTSLASVERRSSGCARWRPATARTGGDDVHNGYRVTRMCPTSPTSKRVRFANSGGVVFVDESAEEIATA